MLEVPRAFQARRSNADNLPCTGHQIPVTHQDFPGKEHNLPEKALYDALPTSDGKSQKYKVAGKLQGKKAIITGGDSGIGRATAVLFALEGADVFIVYLPEEDKDAKETKQMVESHGQKCHLYATDLTDQANNKRVVEEALKAMGAINILFNNAAYQMMTKDIFDISE